MKLRGRFLQLHPGLEAVGGRRSPAHETVDLLLNIDKRLFHCVDNLCGRVLESKPAYLRLFVPLASLTAH